MPKQETKKERLHRAAPVPERESLAQQIASVDLSQHEPSYRILNSLAIWRRRLEFLSVKRRGAMVIALVVAPQGETEITWPTVAELYSFPKSQAIIGSATNVTILPPTRGQRAQWIWIADLILNLAEPDNVQLEQPLKEEIREYLRLAWLMAQQPEAKDSSKIIQYMRAIQTAIPRREAKTAPPYVFIAEGYTWVHAPGFRLWLSVCVLNRMPPLMDIRNGLFLLNFEYQKNLSRGDDNDKESLSMWIGPLKTLEE